MKIKNVLMKGLCGVLSLAMMIPGMPVRAANETNLNVSVVATVIDITVPISFTCNINPDLDNGFTYANNLTVTNNTKAPIELLVSGFADDNSTFANDILPTGLPEGKTWNTLNVSETKKYFALGLKAKDDDEWVKYTPTSTVYAKSVQAATVSLGAINPSVSVNFDLDASYGRAVKDAFTFTYKITWQATLYDEEDDEELGGDGGGGSSQGPDEEEEEEEEEEDDKRTGTYGLFDSEDNLLASWEELVNDYKLDITKNYTDFGGDVYNTTESSMYYILSNNNEKFNDATKLVIDNDITTIGDRALRGCSSLQKIVIPEGVVDIGVAAFQDCSSLQVVNIPEQITTLEFGIFSGCTNLQNIDIPDGVTSIGGSAFYHCSSLQDIDIPDGVTSIEWSTFEGCSSLTEIDIPKDVTKIDGWAFRGCRGLIKITIPDKVETIGERVFDGCTNLQEIDIPDGVTSIGGTGGYVFNNCSNLKTLKLPRINEIGQYFLQASGLEEITIPDSVKTIGYGAFSITKLQTIKIPEGVTTIEAKAFNGCASLTTMELPSSLESIGSGTFTYCNALSTINFRGTKEQWTALISKLSSTEKSILNKATINYDYTD